MCGIAGVRRFDGAPVDLELLKAMAGHLEHRGPDGRGYLVDGSLGLAHTRLSIIDVEGSPQPMSGAGGHHHLVFNGEILNYRQLRTGLSYPFRTDGDTEVLLALYDRYGADGVTRLRGQFAYALFDSRTADLHLFRDRLGILPLYYYTDGRFFAFASEIKALLPAIASVQVDEAALHGYLTHRSVPAPHTFIAGVRKLRQGHHLVVGADGTVREHPYWTLPAAPQLTSCPPEEAVRLVGDALTASVRESLVSDVPVGAYLSGGLDSSLIAALAAREQGGTGLHTFAAGFDDPRLDETAWARHTAQIVGSTHHEVRIGAEDFEQNWSRLSWHRDAPLSEPADVAVFRLAELARRDVKVVLSGEGSDELFGGYPKHRFAAATRLAGVLPSRLLRHLERRLPTGQARLGIALRTLSEAGYPERLRGWFSPFTAAERTELLGGPPTRDAPQAYRLGGGDALHRMLYADLHTWLPDNLLERGDRMSMAASLEMRPPFLGLPLVELAFSLPSNVKVRGSVGKWVVKEVARRHLPKEIVDRPKVGFKVPLDQWFRGSLHDLAADLLTDRSSFVAAALDPRAVRGLLESHTSGRRDEQMRIWTLLSLEVWHRELVSRRTLPENSTSR
ncbi:asparagine synthase (glutamine-hydrolyzing) [Mycolicibacterium arseniciresistens]|uniref:asparagine synthase (glutamine-hydrolyzing) n=1 Tax=Mycolicibacterium arseniciresistens TaxID=3062257 RepID=A0ABT8UI67_9MYCO|nr:asparagine synthase (glutamine-hydrolyzing) [Mycolicibacterium arseniciresistens]MDO3636851.1 asparagine synthase (glutamine-hydrolyzing) [Mycolicibacterium arseniciresistens]